jgi:hypothetical protein
MVNKAALTSLAMIAEVRRKYQDHGATPPPKKKKSGMSTSSLPQKPHGFYQILY